MEEELVLKSGYPTPPRKMCNVIMEWLLKDVYTKFEQGL